MLAEGLEIGDPFDELWDSTIKPADRARYGWDANPWAWVYTFERVRETGGIFMTKQYADAGTYEAKLEKVMGRLGADQYNYDWSRHACWVEFWYKGQYYRFEHSVENANAHGQKIQYGSDIFAQVVLTLEDIARMTERGIYELQVWIAGLKALPPPVPIPECFVVLQFDKTPTKDDVERRFRQLCKIAHPDVGGSEAMFQRLVKAKDQALELLAEAEQED